MPTAPSGINTCTRVYNDEQAIPADDGLIPLGHYHADPVRATLVDPSPNRNEAGPQMPSLRVNGVFENAPHGSVADYRWDVKVSGTSGMPDSKMVFESGGAPSHADSGYYSRP